jgi:hypothetical protein
MAVRISLGDNAEIKEKQRNLTQLLKMRRYRRVDLSIFYSGTLQFNFLLQQSQWPKRTIFT